ITSEDPANGFLPSTGRIEYVHVPAGPGVRWDAGIEAGTTVGLSYDPMLAKLIVWGATRSEAIARMHRALTELTIVGIETSREFHLRVMEDAEFQRGDIEIQWLERRLPELVGRTPPRASIEAAAIAAALLADRDRRSRRGGPTRESGTPTASTSSTAPAMPSSHAADPWVIAARREGVR
ncbi:MAG: acetyl-CoA carboxylase biotin carboxylase subunit, partial [Gemmatimonadota bacterium]